MYGELKDKGFAVLGFPCNDFGGQEPGGPEEILKCSSKYSATFPMFEKVVTKRGGDQSPIYSFLGQSGHLPAWNFSKYVVDKQGRITALQRGPVDDAWMRQHVLPLLGSS